MSSCILQNNILCLLNQNSYYSYTTTERRLTAGATNNIISVSKIIYFYGRNNVFQWFSYPFYSFYCNNVTSFVLEKNNMIIGWSDYADKKLTKIYNYSYFNKHRT